MNTGEMFVNGKQPCDTTNTITILLEKWPADSHLFPQEMSGPTLSSAQR